MTRIFISYRREDSQYQADRLRASLTRHVDDGSRDIFMDIDNIPVGVDFERYINEQVAECEVLFVVIGPNWLDARDPRTGSRRLDDANDFVRLEVAAALDRNIPVVPILLDGVAMPTADRLPEAIAGLALRNGARVFRETFDRDVDLACERLPQPLTPRIAGADAITLGEQAQRLRAMLVKASQRGETLVYREVANDLGIGLKKLFEVLNETAVDNRIRGEPLLCALAVNHHGRPGPGFYALLEVQPGSPEAEQAYVRERDAVFDFVWSV